MFRYHYYISYLLIESNTNSAVTESCCCVGKKIKDLDHIKQIETDLQEMRKGKVHVTGFGLMYKEIPWKAILLRLLFPFGIKN